MDIERQIADLTKRIVYLENELSDYKNRYEQLIGVLRKKSNEQRMNQNPTKWV